jgi:hypothetical protein
MTGFQSKHRSAQDIEIAELKNSLAIAMQKKTLKDEFAMAAMSAIISSNPEMSLQNCATLSYCYANVIMKERMK